MARPASGGADVGAGVADGGGVAGTAVATDPVAERASSVVEVAVPPHPDIHRTMIPNDRTIFDAGDAFIAAISP